MKSRNCYKNDPVRLFWQRDKLIIRTALALNPAAFAPSAEQPGQSAAQQIRSGILQKWCGEYAWTPELLQAWQHWMRRTGQPLPVICPRKLSLEVQLNLFSAPRHLLRRLWLMLVGAKRMLPLPAIWVQYKRQRFLTDHVASPLWRRIWGIFRTGQIESLGLNWSRRQPGFVVLRTDNSPVSLPAVAAHEFGHVLGLGDAYGAFYRFYHAAPGTEGYLMHHNMALNSVEVAMMLQAQRRNRMSFFPRRWSFRAVWTGSRRELALFWRNLKRIFRK